MAEAEILLRRLLEAQSYDGGWRYGNGISWTEPTALALLALEAQGATGEAYQHGGFWLQNSQRPDGGWPPNPSIPVSTSVTSLAALALSTIRGSEEHHQRALHWLVRQSNPK